MRMTAAQFRAMKPAKGEKYHRSPASERTCSGVVYDSKAEMVYHQMNPDAIYKPGRVELPGGIWYEPDFLVATKDGGYARVDIKGVRTPAYNLKMRLYAASPVLIPLLEVKAKYRRGVIVGFETVRTIVPGNPVPRVTKKKRRKA